MMTRTRPRPYVRGFACPTCVGVRLFVCETKRPMTGLIVRYRKCGVCGFKVVTEERKRKSV